MRKRWSLLGFAGVLLYIFIMVGCTSSFKPRPMEEVNFKVRMQTQVDGNLRVTAAVLSAQETEAVFGFGLYQKGIQPIWLEVENKDDQPTWFLPFSVDPDYFSPLEVTYPYHRAFDAQYNDKIDQHFLDHAMGLYLAPGSIRSGFVFTNLHLGTKSFNVDLVGADNQPHTFTFFIPVPGLRSDHQDVDFDNLYAKNEISSYNEAEFKQALRDLPCCTTNPDGTLLGGPINLVIVANGEDLLRVLIRSGWDETASALDAASSQPAISSQVPQSYRYRPVEPLYYYGRSQDASFRESRAAGFESNKLRLWLSPMLYEGKEVWVGQIHRDHVKRSSGKHDKKVDLDEVRDFLIQDLWYSQGVDKLGYVEGKDAVSPISQPKKTHRGVTYLTDGYRAVIWLSSDAVPLSDVKAVNWDQPPLKVDILKIDD